MDIINGGHFWSVLFGALIYLGLGAAWYHPKAFGNLWLDASGLKPEDLSSSPRPYVGSFIIGLILTFVLSLFIYHLHAATLLNGASIGFWAWIGFIATTEFSGVLWGKKSLQLFLIDSGFMLVVMLILGGFLAVA